MHQPLRTPNLPMCSSLKLVAFCLSLLLAAPAAANSIEAALCGPASAPVVGMAGWEKLCRASVRSFSELPASTSAELRSLLTPENLATMAALTSVWLGTQGVPLVGEAVDATLLTLGVVLVTVQAADVTRALWTFANRALMARTEADLRQAASSLAWAISKVGVTVVTFVLTKKVMGKKASPRAPPSEPPAVTPEGVLVPEVGAKATPAQPVAPAAAMSGVLSQGVRGSPSETQATAPKEVDPKAFAEWIAKAPKKTVNENSPAARYQIRHAGSSEVTVSGGGVEVRADGARASDAHLLEVKHVANPDTSPYVPGSSCPAPIRMQVRAELVQQLERYAAVIRDSETPAAGLELITNDTRAASYFETLMSEVGVHGHVMVRP